ncbi:MAG: DUF554 domain-containing protein [Spirochaetae bacterium HGW-Spirochaetae-5]|nr:MAG: DUF554 domain-containing protein [Spirochaetae bacterium HGW-Spirochaetae-5]
MTGLGTVVNAAAIIAGGVAGALLRSGLPERFRDTIMQALGLSIVMIGLSGALQGIYVITASGKLSREYIMLMIFSLVGGAIIGELLNIEDKLEKLGIWIQKKYLKNSGNFAEGFVTASLVFCVGAMAIVGSLEDGLAGDTGTLFAKAVLDGVISVIFAATLGIGVAFSAIPVFLYQGLITLTAGFIKPWLTESVISQTSLVGSILIIAIGINVLELKRIKVGNLLPAVFIPFVYYLITKIV